MIESKNEIGGNGWYDDLCTHLMAKGEEPTREAIALEVARIQWREKVKIRPDTREDEKWARANGEIPDGMTYDEWVETLKPEVIKRWPDLAQVKVGPISSDT